MKNNYDENVGMRESLSVSVPEMKHRSIDFLILYYWNGMSAESIAKIFSAEKSEVNEIISNFAGLFSSKENLMNVVKSFVKMKRKDMKEKAEGGSEELSDKDLEIARLKQELTQAQVKAEAYLEMIKVAEQLYRIPIRKKSGAK